MGSRQCQQWCSEVPELPDSCQSQDTALLSCTGWQGHTESSQMTKGSVPMHSWDPPAKSTQAHSPAIHAEGPRWPGWRGSRCGGATGVSLSAQLHPQMHSFQFSHLHECNKNDWPSSTLHNSSVTLLILKVVTLPYST